MRLVDKCTSGGFRNGKKYRNGKLDTWYTPTGIKRRFIERVNAFFHRWEKRFSPKMTCPDRTRNPIFCVEGNGMDWWRKEANGDRTCSFCGSLHPEDFEYLIEVCIKDPTKCRLEAASGKNYKVYVDRPEVINAGFGGIKFYTWHCQGLGEKHCQDIQLRLNKALKLSAIEYDKIASQFRNRLIKSVEKNNENKK